MKQDKKVVVVSIFSGMDLLLYGMQLTGMKGAYAVEFNCHAANMHEMNFKDPNGEPLINWISVSKEEMQSKFAKIENDEEDKKRVQSLRNHYFINDDGSARRPELVQEVNGNEIRKRCIELFGEDIWIVLIGGPPCTDFSKLNVHNDGERNKLVFEYLRILQELKPDVAVMEEVPDVLDKNHQDLFFEFLDEVSSSGYQIAYQVMNALHYEGCQSRNRCITMMVSNDLQKAPIFPNSIEDSALRSGDVFDIDYFFSGHFEDKIRNKNHWMCTVTGGSPRWFSKGDKLWKPTIQDLLRIQGLKPEMKYIIPDNTPVDQQLKAIGNGVPINLAYHIGKSIMENIFEFEVTGTY